MGGGLLGYDVLLSPMDRKAYTEYKMDHPVSDYEFLLVIAVSDYGGGSCASNFIKVSGDTVQFEAWGEPYMLYATMTGSTWSSGNDCSPYCVLGFKL